MSSSVGLTAWRLATGVLSPLAPLLLRQRAARGKEDGTRLNERLGIAGIARPAGRLIWLHGASVGESLSALPLIEKLIESASVLVTSGTVTSAAMMSRRLPAGNGSRQALHQFVPLDTPGAVARFLDHWKPDAGLFIESDIWPNLIRAAHDRGVKLALVNARISAASAERWMWARRSVNVLLDAFDMVLAQDDEIARRFRDLGARHVEAVGSLKADAPPLAVDPDALAAMRQAIGGRPVLLAAQTHPGEDETILPAHDLLRAQFPDLLTILVPRHTERGEDLEMLCLLLSGRHAGAHGRAQSAGTGGAQMRGARGTAYQKCRDRLRGDLRGPGLRPCRQQRRHRPRSGAAAGRSRSSGGGRRRGGARRGQTCGRGGPHHRASETDVRCARLNSGAIAACRHCCWRRSASSMASAWR